MSARHLGYTVARWIFFLGSMIYLGSFVAKTWHAQGGQFPSLGPLAIVQLVIAAFVFSATALFSVLGWRGLLTHLSHRLSFLPVARVFCLTQIAKYLPGNVGHHIGRVALARASLGIPTAVTSVSIAQESALVLLSALSVGAMCYAPQPNLPLVADVVGTDSRLVLPAIIAIGLAALALANACRPGLTATRWRTANWVFRLVPSWPAVAAALPWYIAISLTNGIAVAFAASTVTSVGLHDLLLLTGAYAVCWMIGFLLPGAPGGLGVREAALVLLLGREYPANTVLSIAFLSRLATVGADLLIFLTGMVLARVDKRSTRRTDIAPS